MLDPKTSVAIDAPPVAPYDDGSSTESEDFTAEEEAEYGSHDADVSAATSSSVGSATVVENEAKRQKQQIPIVSATSAGKTENGKVLPGATDPASQSQVKTTRHALNEQKPPRTGGAKAEEEHCKSCRGYLTPLAERLNAMKTAVLEHSGKEPPPSRQCVCCHITYPLVALTDESKSRTCVVPRCYMCNWAARAARTTTAAGVKRMSNGTVRKDGSEDARWSKRELEQFCRSCKCKLTPLEERLEILKKATLQQGNIGPPPSRQCCCCQITYPLAALTTKSRDLTCCVHICLMCGSASTHHGPKSKSSSAGAVNATKCVAHGHTSQGHTATASKDTELNLKSGHDEPANSTVNGMESDCCRNCRCKLPGLTERLKVMQATAVQLREKGWRVSPPSRQCSCCNITYPLVSLTEKSRSVMCASPVCQACSRAPTHGTGTTEKMLSSTVDTTTKVKRAALATVDKTPEVIVVESDGEDEEGELVEESVCKCCKGKLMSLSKRLRIMEDATRAHKGKGPPPSRKCACCRITYPSMALTKKSRKTARVVAICANCSKAGGPAIYEMLAVSDEFVEAFKIEDPNTARLLLKKKQNGGIEKSVERLRKRTMKLTQPTAATDKISVGGPRLIPNKQVNAKPRKHAASGSSYKPHAVVVARKCISAPRQLLASSSSDHSAAPQVIPIGEGSNQDARSFVTPPSLYKPHGVMMARKCINAPRQLLGSGYCARSTPIKSKTEV
ncbi:unnamed protein product [Phytophthora lilii]|uniref:Unnamed protein product n=1 Tax=Phytophthora lilii TaxID=2077276 RepID=A0A9W6WZS9_9STRA|nr:unnamed protein product [Phytophthora lilii]